MQITPLRTDRQVQEETKTKGCSFLFGRAFKVLESVAKISSVGFLLLGLLAQPVMSLRRAVVLSNSQNASDGALLLFKEQFPLVVGDFETSLSRFPDPGSQRIEGGAAACSFEGSVIETEEQCKKKVDLLVRQLLLRSSHFAGNPTPEGYLKSYTNEKGKIVEVRAHIDTIAYENYQKTLRFVEEQFLAEKNSLADEGQIEQFIIDTQCMLTSGNLSHKVAYREHEMIVPFQVSMDEMEKKAKALDAKEREIYNSILQSKGNKSFVGRRTDAFEQEKKVLHKLGFFCTTAPSQVKQEIKSFIAILLRLVKVLNDPVDLASFVHTEIVRISPFAYPNDLLARVLMNAIYVRLTGGKPIIFPSKERYLQVTLAAVQQNDYTGFSSYLRDEAIPWLEEMTR